MNYLTRLLTIEKLVRVDTPEVDVEICFSSTANVQEQGIIPELYLPEHLEVVSVTMYNPLTKNYDIHDIDWAYQMNGDSPEISNIGGVNYKIVFISELLGECQLKFHMIN